MYEISIHLHDSHARPLTRSLVRDLRSLLSNYTVLEFMGYFYATFTGTFEASLIGFNWVAAGIVLAFIK